MFSQVAHDTVSAVEMGHLDAVSYAASRCCGCRRLDSTCGTGLLPSNPTTTSRATIPSSQPEHHPRPWPCWRMRGRVTTCRSHPWWIAQRRAGLYRESWAVQPSSAQVRVSPKARTIGPAPAARRLPSRLGTAMLGLFPHPSRANAARPGHPPPVGVDVVASGRLPPARVLPLVWCWVRWLGWAGLAGRGPKGSAPPGPTRGRLPVWHPPGQPRSAGRSRGAGVPASRRGARPSIRAREVAWP
jgi:hypothetical protein